MMHALLRIFAAGFLVLAALRTPLTAQDIGSIPVRTEVRVDHAGLEVTGRFQINITLTPEEDIRDVLRVRLALVQDQTILLTHEQAPEPPSKTWKKGVPQTLTIILTLPSEIALEPLAEIGVTFGFFDTSRKLRMLPADGVDAGDGRAWLASFKTPRVLPISDEEGVATVLKAALEAEKSGEPSRAFDILEQGIRRAALDPWKYKLRDAIVRLGHLPPHPMTAAEQEIVNTRIAAEKERYLRLIAGRLYDRHRYHGALLMLAEIGGRLAEDADGAVIGALDEAQRVERDRQDIKNKLLEEISDEDRTEADNEIRKHGADKILLDRAEFYLKKKRPALSRRILRHLRFHEEQKIRDDAYRRLEALEQSILAAIPPDEKAEVEAATAHPAWSRTVSVATHKFILIGPEELIRNIPLESRLRFDLAYIFLTDLFGRRPNPNGDRCTVYFKELWEFGGGVGGGTTIDIGNADPKSKSTRLDNGLLYHELTHCVDDTRPIYKGFREGLANFGAAYCAEAIGQKTDSWHSFQGNLDAFKRDYLERDVPYWLIQNYGPSAGFFLHFIDKYGKTDYGHDWSKYRRFFREYRDLPLAEGRDPWLIRGMAHLLMTCFSPQAFDDLVSFRFPLLESDREAIAREYSDILPGLGAATPPGYADSETMNDHPNSPIPRDEAASRLMALARAQGLEENQKEVASRELGILLDWRVVGPFAADNADVDACCFPPEYETDFQKKYQTKSHLAEWRIPNLRPQVKMTPSGWVSFDFGYMNDTATYALVHVTVPHDQEGLGWIRADDDASVWINETLVNKYDSPGVNSSAWLWWRGPQAPVPDAMKFDMKLRGGRNRVLVKIKNRTGGAGFVLALTDRNGKVIQGLQTDLDGMSPLPEVPDRRDWRVLLKLDFAARGGESSFVVPVGHLRTRNKTLVGELSNGGVPWRKYTVRPGFPKDAPSNLGWLKPALTKDLKDFEISLELDTHQPKIALIFQGDGSEDGNGGWTLMLHPAGGGVAARLERYDRLVYQSEPLKVANTESGARLELVHENERLSVRFGGQNLFDRVSIDPIQGRDRIGLLFWGPGTGVRELELRRPKTAQ